MREHTASAIVLPDEMVPVLVRMGLWREAIKRLSR